MGRELGRVIGLVFRGLKEGYVHVAKHRDETRRLRIVFHRKLRDKCVTAKVRDVVACLRCRDGVATGGKNVRAVGTR